MGKPTRAVHQPLPADAPLYRVTKPSFINGSLHGPGTPRAEVRYAGKPGSALEPLNEAAKAAVAAASGKAETPKPAAAKGKEPGTF